MVNYTSYGSYFFLTTKDKTVLKVKYKCVNEIIFSTAKYMMSKKVICV